MNEKRICPKCNSSIDADSKFCTECGYSLLSEQIQTEEKTHADQDVRESIAASQPETEKEDPVKQVKTTEEPKRQVSWFGFNWKWAIGLGLFLLGVFGLTRGAVRASGSKIMFCLLMIVIGIAGIVWFILSLINERLETYEKEDSKTANEKREKSSGGKSVIEKFKMQEDKRGTLSLLAGIISIPTSFLLVGIVPAVLSLIMGIREIGKHKKTKRIIGIVCAVIGVVIFSFMIMKCANIHKHEFSAATCTEPAACRKCGHVEGTALGHEWITATCTDPQYCSRCGQVWGDPLGHDVQNFEVTVEPTCGEEGKKEGICTRCGATIVETIKPTGDHELGD